jgi:hypothetical protein
MLGLRDPVAVAWRSDSTVSRDGWAERLAKAAKCSPPTVYNRRALWKTKLGIDIAQPLQLYADVLHFGQSSTASPANIIKMFAAAQNEDGKGLVQLYAEALADFELDRIAILNPGLAGRPRAMQLEGPKGGSPDLGDLDGSEDDSEADDPEPDVADIGDIDEDVDIIEYDDLDDLR